MSNVYIQEPPTSGKVLLLTTVGDIDIELWTKEAPKSCRNFMKLCMDGSYHGTTFHRIVKDFIVQGGKLVGANEEEEESSPNHSKGEFHSRLRFCRRGLVAMANPENPNDSQFFITLGATPELQNKHTIFGKVVGDTIYNVLKLQEVETDHNEQPIYPQKILKIKVLINPFQDLLPIVHLKKESKGEKCNERKINGFKNLKLLSFGEEAEEDEEEIVILNKQLNNKSKSAHDNLQDPKLSSITDLELEDVLNENVKKSLSSDQKSIDKETTSEESKEMALNNDELEKAVGNLKHSKRKEKKMIQTGKTFKQVNQMINKEDYMTISNNHKKIGNKFTKTGTSRENFTLELLNKFKKKLTNAKQYQEKNSTEQDRNINEDNAWMTHSLQCENQGHILAKDASTKTDSWFEIYDPRNPINKRRRGEDC